MTSGVYLIENIASPLYYIGQAIDIDARWSTHRYAMKSATRRANKILLHSWQKHGDESFRFVVLEECPPDMLTERERYWLQEFRDKRGLKMANIAEPGENYMRGRKHTPEALRKISLASLGKPKTAIHRQRIGAAHKGKKHTAEEIAKMRATKKERPAAGLRGAANPSCRASFRAFMSANNPSRLPDVRAKISARVSKPVVSLLTGETWPSVSACAAAHHVTVSTVSLQLRGRIKTCGGGPGKKDGKGGRFAYLESPSQ